MANKTFIRITNQDIYNSINEIKDMLSVCQTDIEVNKNDIKTHKKLIYTGLGSVLTLTVTLISALVIR
jgi:hypothetical protein